MPEFLPEFRRVRRSGSSILFRRQWSWTSMPHSLSLSLSLWREGNKSPGNLLFVAPKSIGGGGEQRTCLWGRVRAVHFSVQIESERIGSLRSEFLSNLVFNSVPDWIGQSGGSNRLTEIEQFYLFILPEWRRHGRAVWHGHTVLAFLHFLFLICPVFQMAWADRATTLSFAKQKVGTWSVRSRHCPVRSSPIIGPQPSPILVFDPGRSGPILDRCTPLGRVNWLKAKILRLVFLSVLKKPVVISFFVAN